MAIDDVMTDEEVDIRLVLDCMARDKVYSGHDNTEAAFHVVNSVDFNRQALIKFYYAKIQQYESMRGVQ